MKPLQNYLLQKLARVDCCLAKNFKKDGGACKLTALFPGKYKVTVQPVSLASYAEYEDDNSGESAKIDLEVKQVGATISQPLIVVISCVFVLLLIIIIFILHRLVCMCMILNYTTIAYMARGFIDLF